MKHTIVGGLKKSKIVIVIDTLCSVSRCIILNVVGSVSLSLQAVDQVT